MSEEFALFPSGLGEIVEKNTIPRRLRQNEQLNLFRKYYFPEFNQKFKCVGIVSHEEFIFYFMSNESFQYVLPFPIDYECYTFTLDKYKIMSREIINDNHPYRGYQLKWWFYKHGAHSKKYKYFVQKARYLDDDSVYTVSGKFENGKYVDCKFTLKFRRGE